MTYLYFFLKPSQNPEPSLFCPKEPDLKTEHLRAEELKTRTILHFWKKSKSSNWTFFPIKTLFLFIWNKLDCCFYIIILLAANRLYEANSLLLFRTIHRKPCRHIFCSKRLKTTLLSPKSFLEIWNQTKLVYLLSEHFISFYD